MWTSLTTFSPAFQPPGFAPSLAHFPKITSLSIFIYCCCCCSVAKACLTLCDPMNCSTGLTLLHYRLELTQIHVRWVHDAIHPSHHLLPLSPPALNLSQHQGLFQWIGCSCQKSTDISYREWEVRRIWFDFLYALNECPVPLLPFIAKLHKK